jgi:hypothetical protein
MYDYYHYHYGHALLLSDMSICPNFEVKSAGRRPCWLTVAVLTFDRLTV